MTLLTHHAYVPDTQVVEDDQVQVVPAVSRTATRNPEDLTVQIFQDDGAWHRQAIGGAATACGQEISYRDRPGLRPETYLGSLCKGGPYGCCYTLYEIHVLVPAAVAADKALHERQEREWEEKAAGRRSSASMIPLAISVPEEDESDKG